METIYLKLPIDQHHKYKSRLISEKCFEIIRDKNQKVKKVKLKEDKLPVKVDAVDLEGKLLKGKHVKDLTLVENEVIEERYPELTFQGKDIGELPDGDRVIHAIIPNNKCLSQVIPFLKCQNDTIEDLNPLNNLELLGVKEQIIGHTEKEVFLKYPVMKEYVEVGKDPETDKSIMKRRLMKHRWNGDND